MTLDGEVKREGNKHLGPPPIEPLLISQRRQKVFFFFFGRLKEAWPAHGKSVDSGGRLLRQKSKSTAGGAPWLA